MHGYIIFVVFIYAFYETQPNTKRNQELNQDKAINCEKQIVHLSMIHGLKIVEIRYAGKSMILISFHNIKSPYHHSRTH